MQQNKAGKRNTRVLVFGVFDKLHDGHRFFLQEARHLGTHLVAVVTPDEVAKKLKGNKPHESEETRRKKLLGENLADEVMMGDRNIGSWEVLHKVLPHTIALGYDQTTLARALEKERGKKRSKWRLVHIPPYKDGMLHTHNTGGLGVL